MSGMVASIVRGDYNANSHAVLTFSAELTTESLS